MMWKDDLMLKTVNESVLLKRGSNAWKQKGRTDFLQFSCNRKRFMLVNFIRGAYSKFQDCFLIYYTCTKPAELNTLHVACTWNLVAEEWILVFILSTCYHEKCWWRREMWSRTRVCHEVSRYWRNFASCNPPTAVCSHLREYVCTILVVCSHLREYVCAILVVCTVHTFVVRSDDATSFMSNYSLYGVESCVRLQLNCLSTLLTFCWGRWKDSNLNFNITVNYSEFGIDTTQ
jgi:hypothetical protein